MAQRRTTSPATGIAGEGEGHESVPRVDLPYLALPGGRPLAAWSRFRAEDQKGVQAASPLGRAAPSGKERGRRGVGGAPQDREGEAKRALGAERKAEGAWLESAARSAAAAGLTTSLLRPVRAAQLVLGEDGAGRGGDNGTLLKSQPGLAARGEVGMQCLCSGF